MIKIICTDYFAGVMEFALRHHAAAALCERLDYLAGYGSGENTCELHADWAPNSFAFRMLDPDGKPWFNGGLIYSGPDQRLDGSAPALTVSLDPNLSGHKWSVHT